MSSPASSAAVLGTGVMGAAMARNLAASGLDVTAWNRSAERAEPLAEDGITVAPSAAEAVDGVDAVLTVLADGDSVADVMGDGVLEAMGADAIWVQLSTVGLAGTDRLASMASESGHSLLDAPVLGTKKPAEDGKLIVLVSGPAEAIVRCAPVFDAIGARTVELGDEPGPASRMKLVLNNWLLALTAGLAESLNLAEALEVDPETFLSVIEGGPLDVDYAHMKGAMMINRDYEPSFTLANAAKDAGLVLEAAESRDLELSVAAAVRARYEEAMDLGHGEADMSAVHEVGSTQADERPAAAS
jgi:3-hydroxyisobutyrate dehydrogenase